MKDEIVRESLEDFRSQSTDLKQKFNNDVILIGPIGAGKSTVGKLISKQLNIMQVSVDDLRFKYFKEIGYRNKKASEIYYIYGQKGYDEYIKPFEVHAVKRALETFSGVIDFGGGHSVYEDQRLFNEVKSVLNPYDNVILLLPSEDIDESLRILTDRINAWKVFKCKIEESISLNKLYLTHPSNKELAKMVVYTKEDSPEQTSDKILQILKKNKQNTCIEKSVDLINI